MHRLPSEQQLLILIQVSALLGLSFRIWWMALHRVYMYFFGYLLADLAQIAVLSVVPFDSLIYRNAWLATESLIVCFYVLVVLELYSIVFQDLAGIANLSHRYIKLALGVAILVSLLLLGMEKSHGGMVVHLLTFERAVVSSLVLFVLLITAFLVYYPVPLKRNVIAYSIGYAVYFLVKASSIFIFNLGYYDWNRLISNIWLAAFFGCLLFWLFALNRRGETKTIVIGHQWNPTDEERLLAQLKAINTSLLRAARK
jgi:hypothetical protein